MGKFLRYIRYVLLPYFNNFQGRDSLAIKCVNGTDVSVEPYAKLWFKIGANYRCENKSNDTSQIKICAVKYN